MLSTLKKNEKLKENDDKLISNINDQKLMIIKPFDLEKNSVISRTTKGGFKRAKINNKITIFDPLKGTDYI